VEREAFLARVRSATQTATLPAYPTSDPGLLVPDLESRDVIDLFIERSNEVEGLVHRVEAAGVPAEIVEIAARHGVDSFMAWDSELPGLDGVSAALLAAGLSEMSGVVDATGRLAQQMRYISLGLGVTGAEAAFAESGTLVLRSGPGRPRMASLIPLVHVAVLDQRRIHRSLAHWANDQAGTVADATNVVFVTGPSRTADIEQHINVGVHGPRLVHVILTG